MEVKRRSLLEVIEASFVAAGRKTYLHRLIYIGEHKFPNDDSIKQFFENNVRKINEEYCVEPLTGFFLYYTSHFIHFIEGSEDSLSRHVIGILNSIYEGEDKLDMIKILYLNYHINQRYYYHWAARYAKPPTLIDKIDPESNMEECARQIKTCVNKLYLLAEFLQQQSASTLRSILDHLSEKAAAFLPEYKLLDFLLELKMLNELTEFVEDYGIIPFVRSYQESVWPTPGDYVPYDVFYKIPDLLLE